MRKFGVEIELNSFDQRDFKKFPLGKNEHPVGIDYIESLIKKLNLPVRIESWQNTHNNFEWICKSDSSCGIEICSPVCDSVDPVIKVIQSLSCDSNIKIDKRCSFHVHFDVSDCVSKNGHYPEVEKSIDLASILAWWVKCESVFFDSVPEHRKLNKYCQPVGISDIFDCEEEVNCCSVIKKLGASKYYSCNVFHFLKGSRSSIEFRICDEEACLNFDIAQNWIFLLDHFIKCSINKKLPNSYRWLDLLDVFDFLEFNKNLDLRNWFLKRILKNVKSNSIYWNDNMRKNTLNQIETILKDLQLDKDF